jgi:signal transduction histidine kinase
MSGKFMVTFRLGTRWKIFRRLISQYLDRKIQRRMVLNFVGLGVLPILIVSFILINLAENTVKRYIFERNKEIAQRASIEILRFINEPLTILGTLVQTRDILGMERFPQSSLINRIKLDNPIFQKIFILDKYGKSVVTTSLREELYQDHKNDAHFRVPMQADTFYSPVFFTPSGFPAMLIALPIKRYNTVEGVLVGEIDLITIWDKVDSIKVGKTGYAFLISADGSVIAHRDRQLVLQKKSYSDFFFYPEILAGRDSIVDYQDSGQDMIAAYSSINKLNWGIVVQQSRAEAFELARIMRNRVTIFVLITTLLAVGLAFTTIKRITRPIEVLMKGVREYAESNLSHRIKVKRQDELAVLASEFNSMAESLEKNQRQLRRMERLAALSRFASLVSHEIRNPLNAMNINMQILRRLISQVDSPPEKKIKYLNIITSEIDRMNNLVSNFLAITRPPELHLIRSDIHQVLEEVIITLEAQAKSMEIQVKRKYHKKQLVGRFDQNQLKQVFQNILLNAFEAIPDGGVVTVFTGNKSSRRNIKQSRPMLIIKFCDTGHGIPRQNVSEIFEFYYTTKKTGTGLGLAIAKQIIEGHKGQINIKSEEGRGTEIIIELPLEG